ncbi:MAG: hypothetical protein BWX61_01176 [Bacteroidetes bacterium ADurb.Bin035]|nr:MAG: hypothetical protein BWX61_01176 [Bacteroidetes bacterium ADurb.Bin035]
MPNPYLSVIATTGITFTPTLLYVSYISFRLSKDIIDGP